ncbi:MAG: thiamine pyrophosphate-dependent dehydrogenase E1 component subunit alpha [Azospirillaceae bacterium]|nr:thiamine pyrophosphate-dependent dehydrogenase E1 component subunit alpha [Azospirillaceae bacterium]
MSARPDAGVSRDLLYHLKRIRRVELEIARRYPEGAMRCPVHLSVGQEAVAAAVAVTLRREDLAVSGHRAHAHYLGKGGDLTAMIAEIYGKATGCSGGKGGSMHLIDEAAGFMGSTAIVGGTIPVGVGLALGMKQTGTDQISCIFLGDGAIEAGVFYESLNFAVLKRLPVLFVCENNLYSVYTPLAKRQPAGRCIADVAAAIGARTASGDGNDVEQVWSLMTDAVAALRAGSGPWFLELATYRWLEHCGPFYDNDIGYRSEAEFRAWQARDPVACHQARLIERGVIDAAMVARLDADIDGEVAQAFAAAEAAPFPEPGAAFTDLYAGP